MRKRLVFAAFCILAVPLLFSASQNNKLITSAPFATVALAGRTIVGQWCDCGTPGCICDPGENPVGSARPISADSPAERNPRPKAGRAAGIDFGTGAFLIGLALFMLSRLRA